MWSTSDGVGFSKKHDAPWLAKQTAPSRMMWCGIRRRRLILSVVGLVTLFLFIKNIPTDVAPVGKRYNSRYGPMAPGHVQSQYGWLNGGSASNDHTIGEEYDGSITFSELATSLRPHLTNWNNNNVLFALPDLTSTSNLVPIACEMARNNHSIVHVALLGRQDIDIKKITKLHGISAKDCPVFWHDARPDHSLELSKNRIDASVQAGFAHCCIALRPQIVLVDDDLEKNYSPNKLLHEVAVGSGVTLLTLPMDTEQSIPWIAALDSGSLKRLYDVEINIVIQAYSESAGLLMRLLRSLEHANYDGLFFPHLTIELPQKIDKFLSDFLEHYRWPPNSSPAESRLTLRHRLTSKKSNAAEAALRTLELFYPRSPATSHVLILSPDVELSPSYLHYLMFLLLEYKHGTRQQAGLSSLFGISLEMPTTKLNGREPFMDRISSVKSPLIMSQTPNNNAIMIFGDKWMEMHTFLTQRLIHDPDLARKSDAATSITKTHPDWLMEALQLMQARGLYTLFPVFAAQSGLELIRIHQDMQQSPAEYARTSTAQAPLALVDVNKIMQSNVLTGSIRARSKKDNQVSTRKSLPLHMLLTKKNKKASQNLPVLRDVPFYAFTGEPVEWANVQAIANEFADNFSLRQGDCQTPAARSGKTGLDSVENLFCELG